MFWCNDYNVLNAYLSDKSYIEGYQLSSADFACLTSLNSNVPTSEFTHALRWYNHINALSYRMTEPELNPDGINPDNFRPKSEKSNKKVAKVERSILIIEIRGYDYDCDTIAIDEFVRSIEIEGLEWGISSKEYGPSGNSFLAIPCVVTEFVGTDDIISQIEENDLIQCAEISSFQKYS